MSEPPPPTVVRRERAIRLTAAASLGAKGFSMACTFAQVPLALHYLGPEAYGFWITVFSIVLVLNSVDFGLGVGMQHSMAKAFGTGDMEKVRRTFWTGAALLAALSVGILILGLPAAWIGRWADILRVGDPSLRSNVGAALCIAIVSFAVGLPFNAVARLAAAIQRGWIHAGWIAAGSALSLGLVALAAAGHWGFLWFLAASLLVPTLQGLGLTLHLLLALKWSALPSALVSGFEVKRMIQSSLYFALPQIGLVLVQSAPAIAISVAAGSSAVTAYNLLLRLFSPFQQGQIILLAPVWPAYTEAHEKKDHFWVERAFWRTVGVFLALAAALALIAWKSSFLLSIWVGGSPSFGVSRLAPYVATWCLLQMAAQPLIYYLIGVSRLRQLAWAATPGLFVSTLALFLAARGGTTDRVLVMGSAVLALTLLPPLAWQTWSAVNDR